jgi:hypothetical protein
MSELCKAGEHSSCYLYWCRCSCHQRYATESGGYDATERREYMQRFFECDAETAEHYRQLFDE